MECNKDESDKCIGYAQKYLLDGNKEKAIKFLNKAEKLYPSKKAKGLLAEIQPMHDDADGASASNGPPWTKKKKGWPLKHQYHAGQPSPERDVPKEFTNEQKQSVRKYVGNLWHLLVIGAAAGFGALRFAFCFIQGRLRKFDSSHPLSMPAQYSTALSDGILSLSAFHACLKLFTTTMLGATGFLVIGAAAGVGALRFASSNLDSGIYYWHQYLTWMVSCVGLPLIASAFCRLIYSNFFAIIHLVCSVAIVLVKKYISNAMSKKASQGIAGFALLSMIFHTLPNFNMYGCIGAVVYIVAALVIKTEGYLNDFLCVDLFHYVLVIGNIALMMGLLVQPSPVYYGNM